MNFANQDSQSDSPPNATSIMDTSMGILWDMVIAPNSAQFDEEQQEVLSLIGVSFKLIAEKAHAYEKLMGEVPSQETPQDFFRN
jgi:hypothetical protein|tara:strand:+ start:946 stop:1197 length:252 start_codon:yes stop_codon:yes gene_type:complete